MEIIISHVNMDFDALASLIAAKKLYPDAQLVIADKQDERVTRFLNIYRDKFDFIRDIHVEWDKVTTMILVDVASLKRVGRISKDFNEAAVNFIVYDHHPEHPSDVKRDGGIVEPVGAAVTLLIEEIRKNDLPISGFEATLFGLGLYTDTGNFIYKNTTQRDLEAARYLITCGMNLELVQRFSEQTLAPAQQVLLDHLLVESTTYALNGLEVIVSTYELEKFQGGLALVTNKLLEIKGGDAALAVVKMKNHVYVVGRASSDRVTLLPLLKKFGGGGHKHAGSATVKNAETELVLNEVVAYLETMLKPAITAKEIMSYPVKSLTPDTTIETAGNLMYRYGHSGYPIVEDGELVGLITRRDLDKGNHHGLGHAPVKAYMTTNVVSIDQDTTLEAIQKLIIERNIGRLPVLEAGKIIGIVTRTNIIEMMHNEHATVSEEDDKLTQQHLAGEMEEQLPVEVFTLLKQMSDTAGRVKLPVYLIGGIVRDILLARPNDDIDIVVEGDGILFAKELQADYAGEIVVHDSFGTATWTHPSGLMIDITSSRLEYYERPASLPDVELSTLEEDLQRRDFTINAMALRLNEESFGELIDPFGGQNDLQEKTIKILHNISFIEDPTRIFRAIRFEERFQFLMDKQTEKLALNSIAKVKNLSTTRIVEEMKRLFQEGKPSSVIQRLFELNFWTQLGIQLENKQKSCALAETLQENYKELTMENPEMVNKKELNWFTYFLAPFYVSDMLDAASNFALMKHELKLLNEVRHLRENCEWESQQKIGDYHLVLKNYSAEAIVFVISSSMIPNSDLVKAYVSNRCQLPHHFTGADLMALGLKPGPLFSKLFMQLEMAQLNGEIASKEATKQWIEEFVKVHQEE